MTLPPDFQFSQASLQDYLECPRRFQLRYLLHVSWPAIQTEPVVEQERHMQQGAAFHRLVQQHLTGIPAEWLTPFAAEEPLSRWWQHYLDYRPLTLVAGPGAVAAVPRYPELTLTASLAGFRLVAKYDLLVVAAGGRATILDWKTSLQRPTRQRLAETMQTCVYRFLLIRAGAYLNGGQPFIPEQTEMLYWFAETPEAPERFPYSTAQLHADEARLTDLIGQLATLPEDGFGVTSEERRCRFCPYRSLCDRGVAAGELGDAEIMSEAGPATFDLDFEQIAEIAF